MGVLQAWKSQHPEGLVWRETRADDNFYEAISENALKEKVYEYFIKYQKQLQAGKTQKEIMTGGELAMAASEDIVIRDNIKKEYCKKNNIKLIIIPYTEIDNIPKFLDFHGKD